MPSEPFFLFLQAFISLVHSFFTLSFLTVPNNKQDPPLTMRLIKQNDDDLAAEAAMRGGAIGALKYCTVALFTGGVLNATWPKFRAVRPPQKVFPIVSG